LEVVNDANAVDELSTFRDEGMSVWHKVLHQSVSIGCLDRALLKFSIVWVLLDAEKNRVVHHVVSLE